MKFKELLRENEKIERLESYCGETQESATLLSRFHVLMQEHYSCQQMQEPSFLEMNVPQDVMRVFKELYDYYSKLSKATLGIELKRLEE